MLINSLDSRRKKKERKGEREKWGERTKQGGGANLANLAIDGCTPLSDNVLFVVSLRLGHMIQTHDGL